MVANFLWAAGTNGYLSPAPVVVTGNTHTNTTLDSLSANVTLPKGTLVTGSGIPTPDFITATVAASASVTLLSAATSTLTGSTFTFQQFPVLIGGEASALANGSAVTSSYWNGNGVFRQSVELLQGLFGDVFFQSGGAFTPSVGGVLSGWWLPSFDGGNSFESTVSTPSSTVSALGRAPDFIIPLDNAAYAAGNNRWSAGRIVRPPPNSHNKVLIQNNSGVAMPSTWMVGYGPVTPQY